MIAILSKENNIITHSIYVCACSLNYMIVIMPRVYRHPYIKRNDDVLLITLNDSLQAYHVDSVFKTKMTVS